MAQLIQMVYVSRSTFAGPEYFRGNIEPNAGKILLKSRVNNRNNGLTGVLCFGDGCFFQCLEGEEDAIHHLLLKLKEDPRHSDLTVLRQNPIRTRSFGNWEMKFVAVEGPMMKWLESLGYERFDPYQFDRPMVQLVLDFLGSVENVLNFKAGDETS
ncbi:MAG: BLUF domain-containing protein [Polaromonas sp.]